MKVLSSAPTATKPRPVPRNAGAPSRPGKDAQVDPNEVTTPCMRAGT
jgi:hypothetical protein